MRKNSNNNSMIPLHRNKADNKLLVRIVYNLILEWNK